MKRMIISIVVCGVMILGLTGCSSSKETDKKSEPKEIAAKFEPTEINGITMTIKEGTLTDKGATVIIKDANRKGIYVYGIDFRIDKKEDDKWVKPKRTNDNYSFTLIPYYVDDDGLLEFNQDWEFMYGRLEKGTYRLVKSTFLDNDIPVTEDDIKYFSVEFTIE